MIRILLPVLLAFLALSCGSREHTRIEQQRQTYIQSFQPISYRRVPSPAPGAPEDRITITQDGRITAAGPTFGNSAGQLTEFQRMQLANVFENFSKLADNYPAPDDARPAPVLEIRFGPKAVTASEAAPNFPDHLTTIRRKLESLTRDLPATPK